MSRDAERWLAARDGVAHYRRPRDTRTVCGLSPVSSRFAWPARTRCTECVRIRVAEAGDLESIT